MKYLFSARGGRVPLILYSAEEVERNERQRRLCTGNGGRWSRKGGARVSMTVITGPPRCSYAVHEGICHRSSGRFEFSWHALMHRATARCVQL